MENERLCRLISGIYFENKGIYGAPKIHYLLISRGEHISLKRVQKLMKTLGLRAITVKKYQPSRFSKPITEGTRGA
ncbi:IS3 family transposase [Agrilactobacillus fermenti]|uniref:IS3 family transposase n=1 Tax=Agrilactobacillus fermenti TaxID=2586909 RepID=UPI0038B24705